MTISLTYSTYSFHAGRPRDRGSHSSTFQLNISTFVGSVWYFLRLVGHNLSQTGHKPVTDDKDSG